MAREETERVRASKKVRCLGGRVSYGPAQARTSPAPVTPQPPRHRTQRAQIRLAQARLAQVRHRREHVACVCEKKYGFLPD